MPLQANTDQDLARAGAKQRGGGGRLLLIGLALVVAGLAVLLIDGDSNLPAYIGVTLMTLGAVPAIAGGGLLLSGLVAGRASKQKPLA